MNGITKKIITITLPLSVISAALLSLPTLAYVKGTGNGDLLQTQDRDQLRTNEQNHDMLQTQTQQKLRVHECEGNIEMPQTQERECNCRTSMEQHRYQYRERTRSPEE